MTLVVPNLCDDRSNWADYKPCIQRALGSKGLWRHIEGIAIAPKPYALVAGVPVLMDGATEDQIEAREMKIINYNKCKYLAQHVILSMTKSTLFLLDVEDQLASMKLTENDNPEVHLMEAKQHFQLMGQ